MVAEEEHEYVTGRVSPYTVTQTVRGPGGVATATGTVTATDPVVSGDTPLIRSAATQNVNAAFGGTLGQTSMTVPVPSGLTVGDLLVLVFIQRAEQPTITTPSGWTNVASATSVGESTSYHVYHRLYATGMATPSIVSTSGAAKMGFILSFRTGTFNASTPFHVAPTAWWAGVSGTSTTIPAITTTRDKTVQVVAGGFITGLTPATLTGSAGFTQDEKRDGTSNGAGGTNAAYGATDLNLAGIVQHRTIATASTTATATLTSSGTNRWGGIQFAINPPGGTSTFSPRFAGDPGDGKVYISWIVRNGSYSIWKEEITRMRAISSTGRPANSARNPMIFCDYREGQFDNPFASQTMKDVIDDGRIHFVTFGFNYADCLSYVNGNQSAWETSIVASINSLKATRNPKIWVNLLHEMDQGQGATDGFDSKDRRKTARDAQRKFVKLLRDAGITRQQVAFVGPVYVPMTLMSASSDWNGGIPTSDPWFEYYPDFKGYPISAWTDGWHPAPADFHMDYKSDSSGRVVDMVGQDPYCWHAMGSAPDNKPDSLITSYNPAGNIWQWRSDPDGPFDDNVYEYHDMYDNGGHGWSLRRVLNNLYGVNKMPIFLAESGWPTADFGSYQYGDNPDVDITINHWLEIQDQYKRHGTVGVLIWQQDNTFAFDGDERAVAFGVRYSQYTTRTVNGVTYNGSGQKAHEDTTDSRRKAVAAQLDAPGTLNAIRSS